MPLPDADKKSPRVYTLTQNTDLENLDFTSLQSIGNPIAVEELNEDELRRLVLLNLARLSIKGEWSGLLSAGGGGGGGYTHYLPDGPSVNWVTGDTHWPAHGAPYGSQEDTTTQTVTSDQPLFQPMTARRSSSFAKAVIGISSGAASGNLIMGIYDTDTDTGFPGDLLGKVTVDATVAALVSGTLEAESGKSLDCVAGTTYWMGIVRDSANNVTLNAANKEDAGAWTWSVSFNTDYGMLSQSGTDNALPDPAAPTTGFAVNSVFMGVQYAS